MVEYVQVGLECSPQGIRFLIIGLQDPESNTSSAPPNFLLRLSSDDELTFNFTFNARQSQGPPSIYNVNNTSTITPNGPADTTINGLTFVFASSTKELDNLVTREFHANPNLHKNPNVELVGDYSTGGSPSVQFQWSWRWKAPKTMEDRGGGWRTSCSVGYLSAVVSVAVLTCDYSLWSITSVRIGWTR